MSTITTPNIEEILDAALLIHGASNDQPAAATAEDANRLAEQRADAIDKLHAWRAALPETDDASSIAADCSAPMP